ncbi:hypothetical protein [Aquisalimonas asiatica]|uniref:Tetratricopeptide repeat-containing protein n=1 Tax=Aquisalimonas asiatica TaxID=406100 RepID=A0A1H8QU43_9GAMM|nr:hypothetical protein [Aquisalimonas asiatica]SEO57779.1 hypothetical protein SAMN04488052_101794 [Aquisalimonas asiatica]
MTAKQPRVKVGGILFIACVPLVAGCFSSGSSGGGASDRVSTGIEVLVTDPPVQGASTRVVDHDGDALSTVRRTSESGTVTLSVDDTAELSGATVQASGGRDIETGARFSGIRLQAPVATDGVSVVSPLSTLVVLEADDLGITTDQAAESVAGLLGLPVSAVLGDPAESGAAQRASLKLTRLAAALAPEGQPMVHLAEAMESAGGDFQAAVTNVQMDSGISEETREALDNAVPELDAFAAIDPQMSAEQVVTQANRAVLRIGVDRYLREALNVAGAEQAVHSFADALWKANGRRGIPSGTPQLTNVIRFGLQRGSIAPDDFTDPGYRVPEALAQASAVADIAALDAVDSRLPLAAGEELGSDNAARAEYFFGSDRSPLFRAERLFDDVLDDNVLDPVQAGVAEGLARAGRFDEAEVVLRSRIAQAEERAGGYRSTGAALTDFGQIEQAERFFNEGLAIYQRIIDAKGVENLAEDDAEFYQGMARRLRAAGLGNQVPEALEPLQAFIDSAAGEEGFSPTYSRVVISLREAAEEAVEEAELAGLTPSAVAEATEAVDLHYQAGLGHSETPFPDGALSLRGLAVTNAAGFYSRLGLEAETLRALDEYERLARLDMDRVSAGESQQVLTYARDVAFAYGTLDLNDRFRDLIADIEVAQGEDPSSDYAQRARSQFAIFEGMEEVIDGRLEVGVELVEQAAGGDIGDTIEALTFRGKGTREAGLRFMALQLFDRGLQEEAVAVADAAWELARSEAFAAEASSMNEYVSQGCRKIARMYEWIEATERGRDRMRTCWDLARNRAAGGGERARAAEQLANGYIWLGMNDEVGPIVDTLANQGASLTDPGERQSNLRSVAELRGLAGDYQQALTSLAEAVDLLVDIRSTGGEDADKASLSAAASTALAYTDLATEIGRAIATGDARGEQVQATVESARAAGVAVIVGGDDTPGSGAWPGYQDVTQGLPSPSDRATRERTAVIRLAGLRAFDEAETLARSAEDHPERNRRLKSVADAFISWDDFPGTGLASFDYDGDGRPDFFSPATSQAERDASPLVLDTDIDGDGIADDVDRTPYCADCWSL